MSQTKTALSGLKPPLLPPILTFPQRAFWVNPLVLEAPTYREHTFALILWGSQGECSAVLDAGDMKMSKTKISPSKSPPFLCRRVREKQSHIIQCEVYLIWLDVGPIIEFSKKHKVFHV